MGSDNERGERQGKPVDGPVEYYMLHDGYGNYLAMAFCIGEFCIVELTRDRSAAWFTIDYHEAAALGWDLKMYIHAAIAYE